MRVLIIDSLGSGLDTALRAQRDGHQVKHFIRKSSDNKERLTGVGLVDLVDDWHPWYRWADLILLTDNNKYMRELGALQRDHAVPIIGGNEDSAAWEIDRALGQSILKKHGIGTISGKEFTDCDSAIAYVKKHDRRFVSKPQGDTLDKALSYVSKSPADMVYMLERWKKLDKLKAPFILQEFVEGVEVAVGGWFGPGGFNDGWCENFEFKKLMNDDLGPATGEQGTVLRYTRQSKLARRVLAPLADELDKIGYIGYIDVNCIIDGNGSAWPLEFTTRFGWPTYNIQPELHLGDSCEWLLDLANGKDARAIRYDQLAVGVVLSIPDYPYSKITRREVVGIPVYGLTESLWKHFHPCSMMMGQDVPNQVDGHHVKMPMPVTAGDYVGVMTAAATTVKDAALTCYRRLKKLIVPNSGMWRSDIGKKLAKQLPIIQKHGFSLGMDYSRES